MMSFWFYKQASFLKKISKNTMNRRKFCRIGALALLGTAIGAKAAPRSAADTTLRRARISVVRRNCFVDLQSRYLDDPETGCCTAFTEGQTFTVDARAGSGCPDGFCPLAWECIRHHVEGVLGTSTQRSCGLSDPDGGAVIACCSDGTRPVVFKIEPC